MLHVFLTLITLKNCALTFAIPLSKHKVPVLTIKKFAFFWFQQHQCFSFNLGAYGALVYVCRGIGAGPAGPAAAGPIFVQKG